MMHQFQAGNNFCLLLANSDEHRGEDLKITMGQFRVLLLTHSPFFHTVLFLAPYAPYIWEFLVIS
jgi:hypothetical protein